MPDLWEAALNVLRDNGLVCHPDVIQVGVLTPRPSRRRRIGLAAEPAEPAHGPAAAPSQPAPPEPLTDETGLPPPWHGRFLVLSSLEVRRAGNEVTCRVQVLRIGEILAGEAREIDTPAGRARAAARAVLQAVSGAARGTALSLEGALVLEIWPQAAVSVEATARRTTLLSGLVPIDRSIEDAACLATLGLSNAGSLVAAPSRPCPTRPAGRAHPRPREPLPPGPPAAVDAAATAPYYRGAH